MKEETQNLVAFILIFLTIAVIILSIVMYTYRIEQSKDLLGADTLIEFVIKSIANNFGVNY